MRLRVLGASVSVTFDTGVDERDARRLRQSWLRCLDADGTTALELHASTPAAGARFAARVSSSSASFAALGETFEQFAAELSSAVTHCAIEARAGQLLMLHAAGLSDPLTGRTAVLVGRSGMGKTTAARFLGTHLGYLSDETVAVDGDGNVLPYAKPLSVIVAGPNEPKQQRGPDELGLMMPGERLELGALVLLHRDPDASAPRLDRIGHAAAVMDLVPHTSGLPKLPHPLQHLCRLLDRCGGAVRATYSDAAQLRSLLSGALHSSPASATWIPALSEPSPAVGADPRTRVGRGTVTDAVEIREPGSPSEILILKDSEVFRLGGLAAAVWASAGAPMLPRDTEATTLAERISLEPAGGPTNPDAFEQTAAQMEEHGLIIRR